MPHVYAEIRAPSAFQSPLISKMSKVTRPHNANYCDFFLNEGTCDHQGLLGRNF